MADGRSKSSFYRSESGTQIIIYILSYLHQWVIGSVTTESDKHELRVKNFKTVSLKLLIAVSNLNEFSSTFWLVWINRTLVLFPSLFCSLFMSCIYFSHLFLNYFMPADSVFFFPLCPFRLCSFLSLFPACFWFAVTYKPAQYILLLLLNALCLTLLLLR